MNNPNKPVFIKMAIIMLVIALLGGCFSRTTDATEDFGEENPSQLPASSGNISASYGGEVTLSMRLPKTLNPLLNEDKTVDSVLNLLFEPLTILDEHQKPIINDALVESTDYSLDGFSVFVIIREGAVWSDGTPITAKDIIFSIDTIRSASDSSIYKNTAGNILRCDEVNERSVKINLVQPFSGTPYTMCFPVIPEHYYKDAGAPDSEKNMKPLGNGLYIFNSYTRTDGMKLSASSNALQGRPYIDTVNVLVTPNAASDLNSMDQKIISVISANISEWGKYKSSNAFRVEEYLTSYFDFIGFNFDREYFQNLSVRQAIAYATPIDDIIETVYSGNAEKSAAPVSPDSWLYEGNVKQYGFDSEKAKGLLPPTELTFTILVNVENSERVMIADILKENLQAVGMKVEVEALPFSEYQDRLIAGDYDIFVGGYSLSVIPDLTFAFHSSQTNNPAGTQTSSSARGPIKLGLIIPEEQETTPEPEQTPEPTPETTATPEPTPTDDPEGTTEPVTTDTPEETDGLQTPQPTQTPEPEELKFGGNYMNYRNSTMDLMLSNAFRAAGDYNYQQSMSELQKFIAEDLPIIGIGFRKSAVVADSKIHGDIKPSIINIYQNFKNWFVQ